MASPSVTDLQPPKVAPSTGKDPTAALQAAQEAAKAPAAAPAKPAKPAAEDPFAALDALITGTPPPPQPGEAPPAPPPAQRPPPSKPPAPDATKAPPDATKAPPDEQKAPADEQKTKSGKVLKPVDKLRNAYEESKRKVKELEQSIEALKAAPPPEDPMRKTLAEEKASLAKALEARERRLGELEAEIRFTNYAKSAEFAEKFQKPYEDAWREAIDELNELTVTDEEEGTSRTPTASDLVAICNLPLGEARTKAREMFGDSADDIMAHRRKIRELNAAQQKALETARSDGATREKERMEQLSQQRQFLQRRWGELNTEAAERFPAWFKPDEADPEGNALLEKGYALADKAFSGEQMPAEETVRLHSAIRNKAAGFDRMVYRNRKLERRIADLEAELQAYKSSEPGAGSGRSSKAASESVGTDNFAEEIDALDDGR